MANLEYRKLDPSEITLNLNDLSGWVLEGGLIKKIFSFEKYKDGVVFASAVGYLADRLDHHPDLLVSYGKVTVSMNTHSVDGISPYDFELARRIEAIA